MEAHWYVNRCKTCNVRTGNRYYCDEHLPPGEDPQKKTPACKCEWCITHRKADAVKQIKRFAIRVHFKDEKILGMPGKI